MDATSTLTEKEKSNIELKIDVQELKKNSNAEETREISSTGSGLQTIEPTTIVEEEETDEVSKEPSH